MKDILWAILSGNKKPMDGRLRNRLSVFLVCTLISLFMWSLIKLSRDYEAPVNYLIQAGKLPDGKILVGNPDSLIHIVMSAKGLDLYSRMFMRGKNTIDLNLSGIKLQRKGDLYTGILRTSKLMNEIAQQLPIGAKLIDIEPDTLRFIFEKTYRQRVAVHPELSLGFAKQFQLYDSLRVNPDSVWIYGRKSLIDTLRFLSTEPYTIKNLSQNERIRLKLLQPALSPAVSLSTDSVSVTVNVEKFTEAFIQVPVLLFADMPGVSYRTFPDMVKLTCRVAMRDYKRLDPSMFEVAVDYSSMINTGKTRLPVTVRRKPSFVKVIRTEPDKVECLILK